MRRLVLGNSVTIDQVELMPIEMTAVGGAEGDGGLVAFAVKEPVAVVIRSGGRVWALDLEGRPASLADLLRDVDGLRERLRDPVRRAGTRPPTWCAICSSCG